MATDRLDKNTLAADIASADALAAMTGYDPRRAEHALKAIQDRRKAMTDKQKREADLERDLAAARDDSRTAEIDFHASIVGARDEVALQFGEDSNEVQAVGRTKKSEQKRRGPRKPEKPDDSATGPAK